MMNKDLQDLWDLQREYNRILIGSSPVKDVYWVIANAEGKIVDANGFILPTDPEDEDEDEEDYPEEHSCSCGHYCFDCLGMSWSDFM